MNFLFAVVSSLNRFQKPRRWFGWIISLIVLLQSLLLWLERKEYKTFSDCYFHFRKQARHPWINERAIEYPWVQRHLSDIQNATVLDVGAKDGLPSTELLINKQNKVYTIDLNTTSDEQRANGLRIIKGDIRSTSFVDNFFDAVIMVSTLEHIGISGRYGVTDSDDAGDIKTMKEIFRILKPGGCVLITVPYGVGRSLPLNRLYDQNRITELFKDFVVLERQYYRFMTKYNMWFEVSEPEAVTNNWDVEPWYSLGCFYITKSTSVKPQKQMVA